MIWKGHELVTIGDLVNHGIDACATREEAAEFMKQYRAENPYAYANVGYLSGYYGREDMARIQDWFQTSHPIFGRSNPTPEEAFAAGQLLSEAERITGAGQP
jgi:hypothetical protein